MEKRGTNVVISMIGWYGVCAILFAFVLTTFQILPPNGILTLVLNATGALSLILQAASKKDYPPFVLNIVWFAVALISLIRFFIA